MRCLIISLWILLTSAAAHAERLKQLADLHGARPNQLLGYGLVIGLAGTGDDAAASFSVQSVLTMLQKLGVHVDTNNLRLKNVAAVIVTAELPPFVRPGHRLDVTVSSIGNAPSLEGGILVASPLRGADTKVYAVAQGALLIGGFSAGGASGSRMQKNHTTVARVPSGALVEREPPAHITTAEFAVTLRIPDFTTAVRMAQAIDERLHALAPPEPPSEETKTDTRWATAKDAGTIMVRIPSALSERIPEVWSELERVEVNPDIPTRVVVNERTGTVVLSDGVRLSPVAIAHGGLTMEIKEAPAVSQPAPFSQGRTAIVPRSNVSASEVRGEIRTLPAGASLGDVVRALNTLGVSPRDLVTILQALKASGALRAELEIQ